jgi:hypothetical protein
MKDMDIRQEFHLLQREIEAAVSFLKEAQLNCTAAIDSVRIELEVMKMFIERHHPEFAKIYPKLKEEALQAIDPESLE